MPRPKKKSKSKKEEEDSIASYSLDSALLSTKKTETSLQGLLRTINEGEEDQVEKLEQGKEKSELREKSSPEQETIEKQKIVKEYLMEDIPLTERKGEQQRIKLPEMKYENTEKQNEIPSDTTSEIPPLESLSPSESEQDVSEEQNIPEQVEVQKGEVPKEEDIYTKLAIFIEKLYQDDSQKYELWETQISNILAILRKMRKVTEKNTMQLVNYINQSYDRIKTGLMYFKIKRDDVEKMAKVDIEQMAEEFKKVLGMLELQVKEYQLKRQTDEFIHQLQYIM